MKYLILSIWATGAHHIPFYLITWHGIDPQLQVFPTSGRDSSFCTDHIWITARILKEKFPKSLCGKCYNILCNSWSREISRRAPYRNDFLVLGDTKQNTNTMYFCRQCVLPKETHVPKIWSYCVHAIAYVQIATHYVFALFCVVYAWLRSCLACLVWKYGYTEMIRS
jgi:hypothetical protein